MCILSLGFNVFYYVNHEVLFRSIILPMVDVPPVLRSPGYCRVFGRFWLVSGTVYIFCAHSPTKGKLLISLSVRLTVRFYCVQKVVFRALYKLTMVV